MPSYRHVGIAWFDEHPPPMDEVTLRAGGLPLMEQEVAWPACPVCARPMLFRAQLPLAVSGLCGYDDDRMVLVFECHDGSGSPCAEGTVLVAQGALSPRLPPPNSTYRVVVTSLGQHPDAVARMITCLVEPPEEQRESFLTPFDLVKDVPPSIAAQAVRYIRDAGGLAEARPTAPTVIDALGGKLVPFDDGMPGTYRTTLPPLEALAKTPRHGRLLGLLGGPQPGFRDASTLCACGRPTRTVVRLLAFEDTVRHDVSLGPSLVQVCLRCNVGRVHRVPATRN